MAGEIIRPKDLTPRPAPVASELMVVDNSVNVGAATIKAIVEAGRPAASQAEAQAGTNPEKAMTPLTTKQSIASEVGVSVASKAQGDLAATAVQPGGLATVATTGAYADLSGKPALGTAAAQNVGSFATAAQGGKADTATQPGDLATVAVTGNYQDLTNKPPSLSDPVTARSDLGGLPFINKSSGLERVLVGGLIQNSEGSGWQFVADAAHESAGFNIGAISQTTSYIRVPYEATGTQVRALLITPDDAHSMLGLTVGASIGVGQADIYLGLPLFAGVKYDTINGNEFYGHPAVVDGLSVSHSAGRLTVSHGPIFDQFIQPVVGSMRGGWGGATIGDHPSPGTLETGGTGAGNSFDVQNVAPMSGKVRWVSGTTFAIDTGHAGTFTATWDGTRLTVVHPRAQSAYDFSATSLGNKLLPGSVTETGFTMQFQNAAGGFVTTPDAFFNFHFTRAASFQRLATFPNRFFSFARGQVRVNPNKVYGGGGGLLLWGLIKG